MTSKLTLDCVEFKPVVRNSLRGFAKVRIAEMRMTIHDVAIHAKDGGRWAQPPSKPMVGRDGVALKDDHGKTKYSTVIEFESKAVRDAFSHAVVAAVLERYPGALEESPS